MDQVVCNINIACLCVAVSLRAFVLMIMDDVNRKDALRAELYHGLLQC